MNFGENGSDHDGKATCLSLTVLTAHGIERTKLLSNSFTVMNESAKYSRADRHSKLDASSLEDNLLHSSRTSWRSVAEDRCVINERCRPVI